MKEKRGAINLSMNFIVMLIISIVVFGFAIYMLNRIFTFAEEEKLRLDEQTEKMIENALDRGEKIFIPRERRTIYPGDTETFGMGILNVLGSGNDKFGVLISFTKAFDKADNPLCEPDFCRNLMNTKLVSTEGPGNVNGLFISKDIDPNKQKKFLIGIAVPKGASSGTYIYNVYVAYGDDVCTKLGGIGTFDNCNDPGSGAIDPDDLYDSQIHKLYVIVP